ncbi:hypothetical protein SDJN02_11239, partial [Cucurbita argyrosperma subsp. argyrosperma]
MAMEDEKNRIRITLKVKLLIHCDDCQSPLDQKDHNMLKRTNTVSYLRRKSAIYCMDSIQISLLSATVGLARVHGPVELDADGETIRNFVKHEWYYKVGLDGEKSEFFNPNCQTNGALDLWQSP